MYRKPSLTYSKIGKRAKRNHMGKKFSRAFEILLDSDYYEGTKYGKYFNTFKTDGTNEIYIKDILEKELDEICLNDNNTIKYLVGFTGMGKTTLLRNYFHIIDRDALLQDNRIIIYISFYYSNLSADSPQQSVEGEIVKYLLRALRLITRKEGVRVDSDFWNNVYAYIDRNKPTILEQDDFIPGNNWEDNITAPSSEEKKRILKLLCRENPIEYYSCVLKYVMSLSNGIRKIIFIYDDIESKEGIYHRPIVEVARHLHSCFSAICNEDYVVKTLVSLRAYTFRSNIDRQLEARRECIENNTILKKETVKLHDIFQSRYDVISKKENYMSDGFREAKKELDLIEEEIYRNFGDIIYRLANCNLCNAMLMFCNIMVNKKWISKKETDYNGAFKVNHEEYRLTAENVFYAIACGNESCYFGDRNNFLPNILYNYKEGSDLLCLYVIRYMIKKEATDLYGETYIEGKQILNDILSVFIDRDAPTTRSEDLKSKLLLIIEYMHNNGILLRSIYDIEDIAEERIEHKYKDTYLMYLSPRGKCLYEMLSVNALLFELYRDDIYTDLDKNDVLTEDMCTRDVMKYLLDYISVLFQYEKNYIGSATRCLDKYIDYFGSEFITVPLLEGVTKNIKAYYPDRGSDYEYLYSAVQSQIKQMEEYRNLIKSAYRVEFKISSYLENIYIFKGTQ